MIKYNYAKDENGNIVRIDNAVKGQKYYCIGCGKAISAKLGEIRHHHFSHKRGEQCDNEGYLHKLAKWKIVELFQKNDSFFISYYRKRHCKNETCFFKSDTNCVSNELEDLIDLKQYYDAIKEEATLGDFKADILLSNSHKTERQPVAIEIKVTHRCENNKWNSKHKIIEVSIEKEIDVENLGNQLVECETIRFNNSFNRVSRYSSNIDFEFPMVRFYLYRSGKARTVPTLLWEMIVDYEFTCADPRKKAEKFSILELEWEVMNSPRDVWPLLIGLVKANEIGYNIRNCWLCKYHAYHESGGFGDALFCKAYKSKYTPRNPEQNYAVNCSYYGIEQNEYNKIKNLIQDLKIKEYK